MNIVYVEYDMLAEPYAIQRCSARDGNYLDSELGVATK